MFHFPDNLSPNPVLRDGLDAQAGQLASLAQRGCDLLARVSELNLQLARHAIETTLDTGRQMAACTDPMQLVSVAMHGWQPAGEHLRNYQQGLMGVLAETQTGLGQAAAMAPVAAFAGAARSAQASAQAAAQATAQAAGPGGTRRAG